MALASPERFAVAVRRFNEENNRDPNHEVADGISHPRESLYARRLADWVLKLCPDAGEALQLASWSQHLCRWEIPRDRYELNRAGYLRWRNELKAFHAQKAGEILRAVGYPESTIRQVQELNLKKNFPSDPASRVLEDALCLVFLEFQLADLAAKTDDTKVINALRKSWQKMSPAGQQHALALPLGTREKELLARAFSTS